MSSGQELGLPDQHKVRAREIRRKLHFSWSERYEKEHRLEERARKAIEEAIRVRLEADLPACELLLALFASAAASTRRTTVCSPFPRSLVGPDGPLFEESLIYVQSLPSLSSLLANPGLLSNLALPTLKLLDWIINCERDGFSLHSIPLARYLELTVARTSARRQQAHTLPDYVFEVRYVPGNERSERFEAYKTEFGVIMGHHGSALENFHSIARFGLDESFGRSSSIYGDGIYLSADREVAHSFLQPAAHGLAEMTIGDRIGVLTASEVALSPAEVRHSGSAPKPRQSLLDEPHTPLPPGYIISTSSHFVLTRYLLLTSERISATPISSSSGLRRYLPPKSALPWIIIAIYIVILLVVWYSKGRSHRISEMKRLWTLYGPLAR